MSRARRKQPIYFGWFLLAALCVTEPISWGILYDAFTVFLKPMEAELGWSSSQLTGAFSLSLLIGGFAGIPIGRWLDQRGARAAMTTGSIAATALVLAWSRVHSLAGFYAIWIGIGLASALALYEPAFVAIANWFHRLRPRALMAVTFTAGCSTIIFVPLSSWLVSNHGWRTALVILAALLGAVTIPLHAFALRRRPEDHGLTIDGDALRDDEPRAAHAVDIPGVSFRTALRDPGFWWLGGAYFLAMAANVGIGVHLIPLLGERGYDARFAALAAGAIGLAGLPGRLFFLPLSEWIPLRYIVAAIFALQACGLAVLLATRSRPAVWLFVILFGAGIGAISASRASLVADAYGPKNFGAINGAMAGITTLARSLAPVGGSLIHDQLGGYRTLLIVLCGCSAGAALAITRTRSTIPTAAGATAIAAVATRAE